MQAQKEQSPHDSSLGDCSFCACIFDAQSSKLQNLNLSQTQKTSSKVWASEFSASIFAPVFKDLLLSFLNKLAHHVQKLGTRQTF